jgi:transcriptional regulator of acetoin/glycerol metabolism
VVDEEFVKLAMECRDEARPVPAKPLDAEELERALFEAGGKIGRAARSLGIHRATLWRRRRRTARKGEGSEARKEERVI